MMQIPSKRTYRCVLCCLALLIGTICKGQQTPVFPEYNYNPFIINSAYAGFSPSMELTFTNTGLFSSLDGSPNNLSLSFHTPMKSEVVGLGGAILRDKVGVTTTTNAFAAYSYKIFFDFQEDRPYWDVYQKPSLSFGITAGIQKFKDNLLELGILNDPAFEENIDATLPTIGVGILFNKSNFYVGFSTPNILGTRFASDDSINLNSPYYGYFGYRFFSSRNESLLVKPSILVKYENGGPLQGDFNLGLSFRNQLEFGLGYRTNSSFNVLGGVYLFESLRIIYSYNVASKNTTFGNTHGIILSYRFNRGYSKN